MLKNAELYHDIRDRKGGFGFELDRLKFDWNKIIRRSREVSEKGTSGVDYLFRKNKIDSLRGEASRVSRRFRLSRSFSFPATSRRR